MSAATREAGTCFVMQMGVEIHTPKRINPRVKSYCRLSGNPNGCATCNRRLPEGGEMSVNTERNTRQTSDASSCLIPASPGASYKELLGDYF